MNTQLSLSTLVINTLIIFTSFSSCNLFSEVTSQNELLNTVWEKQKVEILDENHDVIRIINPFSCESDELLKFAENDQLIRINNCASNEIAFECGQWELLDNQLKVSLGVVKLVPGLCDLTNHRDIVIYNELDYLVIDNQLIIEEKGIDAFRNYLSADTINKLDAGELLIKTYYLESNSDIEIPNNIDCCDP